MVRLSVLAVAVAAATAAHPFAHRFNVLEAAKHRQGGPRIEDAQAVPEEWYDQKLDHLSPNATTWKQRYFTNDEYYGGPGSPVFVYIEGEGVAGSGAVTWPGLLINTLAKKHKALLVSLEHRYYGKSQPVKEYTPVSMRYLRSYQAIEDLNKFQNHVTYQRNLTADSKWVAFGGSYPGMLAAWAKSRYPKRWAGAIASSAPILAKSNFFEYADTVAFGLNYYGKDACMNSVKAALEQFHALVASTKPEDVAQLNKLFKLCTPIKDDFDRAVVEANVYTQFQNLAQGNDWGAPNLKSACDFFTAADGKSPVEKLAKFNAETYPVCTESDYYESWVKPVMNTTASTTSIARQWTYQTCVEFGFGQNTASAKSLFNVLTYATTDKVLYELCKRAFGFQSVTTDAGVSMTNQMYGGLKINTENVVFVNGNIDPWSSLSLTNATGVVNPKSEVVHIDGTSHCGDMFAPSASDSASLQWAHQRITTAVEGFLRNKC